MSLVLSKLPQHSQPGNFRDLSLRSRGLKILACIVKESINGNTHEGLVCIMLFLRTSLHKKDLADKKIRKTKAGIRPVNTELKKVVFMIRRGGGILRIKTVGFPGRNELRQTVQVGSIIEDSVLFISIYGSVQKCKKSSFLMLFFIYANENRMMDPHCLTVCDRIQLLFSRGIGFLEGIIPLGKWWIFLISSKIYFPRGQFSQAAFCIRNTRTPAPLMRVDICYGYGLFA